MLKYIVYNGSKVKKQNCVHVVKSNIIHVKYKNQYIEQHRFVKIKSDLNYDYTEN